MPALNRRGLQKIERTDQAVAAAAVISIADNRIVIPSFKTRPRSSPHFTALLGLVFWCATTQQSSIFKMINAVLVFNNNGQPRLTKFYTTLVCPPRIHLHRPTNASSRILKRNNHSSRKYTTSSPSAHLAPATSSLSLLSSPKAPPAQPGPPMRQPK